MNPTEFEQLLNQLVMEAAQGGQMTVSEIVGALETTKLHLFTLASEQRKRKPEDAPRILRPGQY